MINEYKLVADSYECAELQHKETKVKVSGTDMYMTVSKFVLTIPYKNHIIRIENEYGASNPGKLEMKLKKGFLPNFEVRSQSHLKNIFLIKKKRFVIDCSNLQYKLLIEEWIANSGMETIAKENLFEPHIRLEKREGSQSIVTEYHLQLKDKIGGLKAMVQFYKNCVDGL